MGLIDFVKTAGRKIFGKEDDVPAKDPTGPTPQDVENRKAAVLASSVRETGIRVDGLEVKVNGEVAVVHGSVGSQADREKVVLVLGNTEGIARVDDRLAVEKPEPEATFYTVKKGDTLWAIAKTHYGDGNRYTVVFEANRPMLTDPDKIYPGQVLRIPPAS